MLQLIDCEWKRLDGLWNDARDPTIEFDPRIGHFSVYLSANRVDFTPFIYWTLLIHLASFPMQLNKEYVILSCYVQISFISEMLFR